MPTRWVLGERGITQRERGVALSAMACTLYKTVSSGERKNDSWRGVRLRSTELLCQTTPGRAALASLQVRTSSYETMHGVQNRDETTSRRRFGDDTVRGA